MSSQTAKFWKNKDVDIPSDFCVKASGVYLKGTKKNPEETRISNSPLIVEKLIRDFGSEDNWQANLKFINIDNKEKELQVKISQMRDREIISLLLDSGYHVVPGQENEFRRYLSSYNSSKRAFSYSRLGYLVGDDGTYRFALPDKVLEESDEYSFIFRKTSSIGSNIGKKGTFEDWKSEVAAKCKDNPYLIFALSLAFAPPLLFLAQSETGGFHFFGSSSRGKTTLLQVASSVWGNGAFTANANDSYIKTWSTTVNAIEGIASEHNDLLLPFDELGQCDSRDFQRFVYNLSGGQGKARLSRSGSLIDRSNWRLIVLSSGEISISDKIREANAVPKTGQLVRFFDIPVHDDIIVSTGDVAPKDFVNELKYSCSNNYGFAGEMYLKLLIHQLNNNKDDLFEELEKTENEAKEELLKISKKSPERLRAVDRFALVGVAGQLASFLLDLDISDEEILESVKIVYRAWDKEHSVLSAAEKAVFDIREAIKQNPGLFADSFQQSTSKLLGYKLSVKSKNFPSGETLFAFTSEGLNRVTKNASIAVVCKELIRRELLHQNNPNRNQAKLTIPGCESQMSFYAVKSEILSEILTEDEKETKTLRKISKDKSDV